MREGSEKGVTFYLTARGESSGLTTQRVLANPSADLDQCANGSLSNPDATPCQSSNEWVNGNLGGSKAHYNEGDSVPYRLRFGNLSLASHTVTIEWDTTKSDKHALDYVTTFDRTVGPDANPCVGVSGCSPSGFTSFAIPKDPQVDNGSGSPIAQLPGDLRIYGGTITGVSAYSYPDGTGFIGDKSARISITFTPSVANPVLAWGGHISTRVNWGTGSSCVAIPGSPFHTRLIELDGSGGNQDRSLSSDAVIFPGSITIIKDAVPDGDQDFGFTTSGGLSPTTFSLDDDADATLSNTQAYSNITTFTNYGVSETAVSGWTLSLATPPCTVTSANGGGSSSAGSTVTINMKEGEDYTCTFTNTRQAAHLIVIKHVVNDSGGSAVAGDFTMTVTGGSPSPASSAGAESPGTDVTLTPNTAYSVSETGPSGYTASYSTDCTGTGIAPGATKTCTVTNDDQQAKLTVIKHVVNDNGGSAVAGDFTMSVTNSANPASFPGAETPGTEVNVNPGSYSVGETGPSGYTASYSAECSGSIALGESKTCTVTNDDQQAKLTVIKHVVNDNGGSAVAGDFTMSVTNSANPASFPGAESPGTEVNVNPGSYSVGETGPSGYTASYSAECSGSIALGESKTCTVTNDDNAGTLIVIKHVINDNGGSAVAADFTLDAGGTNDSPDNFAGAEAPGTTVTLDAGSYNVTESGPSGYSASYSADCTGSIANGQTKTCTVTNNDQAATLTVIKHVINDNGGTKVAGDFTMNVTGSNVAPSSSFPGAEAPGTTVTLDAGAYSVDENLVQGYLKSIGANCSGTIANGETRTCTITNDDQLAGTVIATTMTWTLKDKADLGDDLIRGDDCGAAGTITFFLYRHGLGTPKAALTCDDESKIWESDPGAEVDGEASTSHDVDQDGVYLWVAVYTGNNCNLPSQTDCGSEVTEITNENPIGASLLCTAPSN
jgi:hypothetical protein